MNDDMLRQRYNNLGVKLVGLNDKLLKLNDLHDEVNLILKGTLLVDNKIVREEEYSNIININNDVRNEISTVVIPLIDRKL